MQLYISKILKKNVSSKYAKQKIQVFDGIYWFQSSSVYTLNERALLKFQEYLKVVKLLVL